MCVHESFSRGFTRVSVYFEGWGWERLVYLPCLAWEVASVRINRQDFIEHLQRGKGQFFKSGVGEGGQMCGT